MKKKTMREVVEKIEEHQDRDDLHQGLPERRRVQGDAKGEEGDVKNEIGPKSHASVALHGFLEALSGEFRAIGLAIQLAHPVQGRNLEYEKTDDKSKCDEDPDEREGGLPIVGHGLILLVVGARRKRLTSEHPVSYQIRSALFEASRYLASVGVDR